MSNLFVVDHVDFHYSSSEELVLNDLSFRIKKGSFYCISGPNGSGKSTLVKLLAGIMQPTGGIIKKETEFAALVFQNPENQFVSNIVEEDVAFGPENLCFPSEKIRQVVDDSLKCVDMLEEKNRLISSLSGGEKQRVAIAGALALSSDCLILDEPTSMLGFEGSRSIGDYIKKLNKESGVTVICVTQDPELLMHSDEIILIKAGKLVDCITPEVFVSEFDNYRDCGIDLPESIKLVKLLNEKGFGIKLKDLTPEKIVEEIQKKC